MRPPTSAFENRTHGAEKIGPSRYSDFFNRIDHKPLVVIGCEQRTCAVFNIENLKLHEIALWL
jgi:hypothetical protein